MFEFEELKALVASVERADSDRGGGYRAISVDSKDIYRCCELLRDRFDYPLLLDITAVDRLKLTARPKERFKLVYIFRHANFRDTLIVETPLREGEEKLESITSLFFAADWLERETYDQYGIEFTKHPNLKRILNHMEFEGHPLRKDYPIDKRQLCTRTQDMFDELFPKLERKGLDPERDALMILNLGPSHPASHGTIRTITALDGERIVAAASEIGYLHRGFEKSAEECRYNQIVPYTDRLNYCSALMNNIGYAKCVEDRLGIELPARAVFIRVMLAELSRIIDHLVCLAAGLLDMGAQTNYWYLFNPRNDAYDFLSRLTGARLTNSYMRIGGMTADLYEGWESDLQNVLRKVEKGVDESLVMIEHNRIFIERTQDISPVSAQEALSYGFTGPNLRASGVPYDLRFARPYYFYDDFDFEMVIGSHGDTYDRMMVRFEEISQSIGIIRQAMKEIPEGAINIDDKSIVLPPKRDVYETIEGTINQFKLIFEGFKVPAGELYSATEAANGELGFYLVSDGGPKPYKLKVRAPSLLHMQAYPDIITDYQLADAIMTLGSLNIIAGEMDR